MRKRLAMQTLCGTGLLAAVLFSAPVLNAGEAGSAPGDILLDRTEAIAIAGVPLEIQPILPANETEFRFKSKLTGEVMTLKWNQLEASERKRLQKIYGLETQGDRIVFGNKIKGVRYTLETGRTVEGLPLPERSQPGVKVLRTANAPTLQVAEREIKAVEEFEAYESDFYSPQEIYQRWVAEAPPGHTDAAAHYNYAEKCAKIGLFAKALEHLEMATVIDPRMAERTEDFKRHLITCDNNQQVEQLYTRLLTAKRGGDYFTALDMLDRLDRNFPNHDWKSRWGSLRPEIEKGTQVDLRKRVIYLSYTVALDLLGTRYGKKNRVDARGNLVDAIPGKMITTRAGHVFRGVLEQGGEPGVDVVLRTMEQKLLTIGGKDVISIKDVDLSKAEKETEQTYDQLKEYVTDTGSPDGLKGQMISRIALLLKQPEAKVREIFEGRLSRTAEYRDGVLMEEPSYVSMNNAHYGNASWLRDGAQPGPLPENNTRTSQGRRYSQNRQNNYGNQVGPVQQTDPDNDPNLTDDPAVWWKYQNHDTRLAYLRAVMAEKVFRAKSVQNDSCTNCQGKGYYTVQSGGGTETVRCPQCRGIGYKFKLIYQ